ncbi:type 11 methyltransferase [uncultured Mediterranean phage]|nr:type 11 methyltransferase [uncultured Mediterranean phage]
MIIDESTIENIFSELDSKWERVEDSSKWRWPVEIHRANRHNLLNNPDIFQYAYDINYNPRFWAMVECINNLDGVSDLTLLDMGCDVGLHSMVATQKFKKVIGLDRHELSCKRAFTTQKVFTKNGYDVSNFQIENQSYSDYCFEENEVDAILWSTGSGLFSEEYDGRGILKKLVLFIENLKLVIIEPGKPKNNIDNGFKYLQDCKFDNIEIVVYRERTFLIGRK